MDKEKLVNLILDLTFYGGIAIMIIGLILFLNNTL